MAHCISHHYQEKLIVAMPAEVGKSDGPVTHELWRISLTGDPKPAWSLRLYVYKGVAQSKEVYDTRKEAMENYNRLKGK